MAPKSYVLRGWLAGRAALAVGLFSGGVALEGFLMIRRALWLHGTGPICGLHGSAASLHCPGCYAAMALMLSAVAVAAAPTVKAAPARA